MALSNILSHSSRYAVADLVTIIRDEISEPTERIFSSGSLTDPDDLDGWIDMGASITSVLGLTCEQEEEITVGAGIPFYMALDARYVKIVGAVWKIAAGLANPAEGLQKIRPQAYGEGTGPHSTAVNQPARHYWTHGNGTVIRIHMIPKTSTSTNILKIFGFTRITSHDTTKLPEEMQIAPLYYTLANVYARLGKHSLSALNMAKFVEMCNSWRINHANEVYRVDSYSSAKIPDVVVTTQ